MNRFLTLLGATTMVMPMFTSAEEQADISANVIVTQAMAIDNVQGINFGTLEFDATAPGGLVNMNPYGQIFLGTTGYTSSGTANAGGFDIIANLGANIVISCSNTATLAHVDDATVTIEMQIPKFKFNGIVHLCADGSQTMISSGTDSVGVSGKINLPTGSAAVKGSYSTANTGGSPVQFTISYL